MDPREKEEYGNSPFFGINLGIDNYGGSINVGDKIFVIQKPKSNSFLTYWILFPLPIAFMFLWKRKYFS